MRNQLESVHIPQRTIHLYHCDHRGLPLALINEEGKVEWSADYDVWGNLLREDNPHSLVQDIRLPGQQYDEETGLHYNRHRYYDPRQGRYITQDPIGLKGGWNLYQYPLDPVSDIDPLGLSDESLSHPSPSCDIWSASQALNDRAARALTKWMNETFSHNDECPPCDPPVGEQFNKTTHYDHDHGNCKARTGSQIHWHFQTNNQEPYPSCKCHLQKYAFGGCGVALP